MLEPFRTAETEFFGTAPAFAAALRDTLPLSEFDAAEAEITSWEGYAPTPLYDLPGLANELNLAAIHYKHEGPRFGLGSFKALGGAYAVLRCVQRALSIAEGRDVSVADIQSGAFARQIGAMTIISATDGNHGRSVAWGAGRLGAKCRIYIHAEVSQFRADAMRELGAEVVRIDGDYDASVAQTKTDAEKHGWYIVSDTSWPGYTQPPRDVMAGYGVMAREICRALPLPPTHVFLQGGVGGLAAGVIAALRYAWGDDAPRNIIVEPEFAPCLFASARKQAPTTVAIERETIMAGLSCGEPSALAWTILEDTAHGYMTIPDELVGPAVRLLANGYFGDPGVEAGESGVAGLIGLICGALSQDLREALALTAASRVLLIGSEGITDPEVFQRLMSETA